MAGMMQFQPGAKKAPAPEAKTSQDMNPSNTEQGIEASPEEQAQYDQFVKNGLELIYPKDSGQVAPEVMKTLEGPLPVEALAEATATLTAAVQNSAMKNGLNLSGDVVIYGGKALMEELATIAAEGKVHDFTDEEMKAAAMRAVELFEGLGGKVDKQGIKGDFEAMMQADQSGELARRFPGLQGMAQEAEGLNGGAA